MYESIQPTIIPLPQLLTQSHVSQPANITHVVPHFNHLLAGPHWDNIVACFKQNMSELRQFLIDSGLVDEDESLSQGLCRLEEMCTEALQDQQQQEPSATSTAMLQGERFIF